MVRIVPQVDLRSRTFPVKLRVDNPRFEKGHLFKAGMLARVRLALGPPRPSLLVLKNALVLGGRNPVVFVVRIDPGNGRTIATPVEVVIGGAENALIQVTGALQKGDRVVVKGNERLSPGEGIRIVREEASSLGL